KDAGRRPPGVAEDRPALGCDGVLSDLRRAECRCVEPARMAAAAAHDCRTIAGHSTEVGRGRPAAPVVLVEATAGEPLPWRELARAATDLLQRLLDRLPRAEVELRHLKAPPHEVHVRVEPAGCHEPGPQIDALGRS